MQRLMIDTIPSVPGLQYQGLPESGEWRVGGEFDLSGIGGAVGLGYRW
jgi:hypothetical protein